MHIQLGRNGDLILLLPCWRKICETTGEKPVVIVCREYAGVLRGASYVEPDVINGHWYMTMPQAKQMAELKYGQFVVTQCHGRNHGCDMSQAPTFGQSMWGRAGFPGQYGTLPLVFDRRNPTREQALLRAVYNGNYGSPKIRTNKPIVLYNFAGASSPFAPQREVRHRLRRYEKDFNLVNIGTIRATYVYDLLGLYDAAAGLVTIDTCTLHLAAASKVPMLAYRVGGWNSAVPKPGSMMVDYAEALQRLEVVDQFMQSLRAVRDPEPKAVMT